MKDKIVAALLAFFAGGFGVHRFYLGQIGKGVMYFLFCWTTIPFLIAFIDAIMLLVMSDHRFNTLYNPDMFRSQQGLLHVADELDKLDQLFQKGVITFEEFEIQKSKLLQ